MSNLDPSFSTSRSTLLSRNSEHFSPSQPLPSTSTIMPTPDWYCQNKTPTIRIHPMERTYSNPNPRYVWVEERSKLHSLYLSWLDRSVSEQTFQEMEEGEDDAEALLLLRTERVEEGREE